MFAALNIDRGNITNAVSDNMLDDLDITQADYVSSDQSCIFLPFPWITNTNKS